MPIVNETRRRRVNLTAERAEAIAERAEEEISAFLCADLSFLCGFSSIPIIEHKKATAAQLLRISPSDPFHSTL